MVRCPVCDEIISDQIEEGATEGQLAEFLAGFRECMCGWEGHIIDVEPDERDEKNAEISKRTKDAISFEAQFAKACWRRGWLIVPSNVLATYLLKTTRIRNDYFRNNSKLISNAIRRTGLKNLLLDFFVANMCEPDTFYPNELTKVYGLPDFVILTPYDKKPIWVEVKSGSSKLSPNQRRAKEWLEDIGFKVLLYRGGRISVFEKQVRSNS